MALALTRGFPGFRYAACTLYSSPPHPSSPPPTSPQTVLLRPTPLTVDLPSDQWKYFTFDVSDPSWSQFVGSSDSAYLYVELRRLDGLGDPSETSSGRNGLHSLSLGNLWGNWLWTS